MYKLRKITSLKIINIDKIKQRQVKSNNKLFYTILY